MARLERSPRPPGARQGARLPHGSALAAAGHVTAARHRLRRAHTLAVAAADVVPEIVGALFTRAGGTPEPDEGGGPAGADWLTERRAATLAAHGGRPAPNPRRRPGALPDAARRPGPARRAAQRKLGADGTPDALAEALGGLSRGRRRTSACAVVSRWSSRAGSASRRAARTPGAAAVRLSGAHRDRPVRRDELAEALWSGKGAPPAYESLLAPPLSRLRKALGPGVLEGRSELQLILPEDAWIDWEVARAAPAARGRARRRRRDGALEAAARGGRDRRARAAAGLEAPWIDARRARARRPARGGARGAAAAGAARRRRPAGGRAGRPRRRPGPAVPRVGPRRADGGAARPRQRQRGAARLRGHPGAAARGARQLARRRRSSPCTSSCCATSPRRRRAARPPPARRLGRWSSATARSRCWTAAAEAAAGEGRAVLIEGPPGIGKSRLLAESGGRARPTARTCSTPARASSSASSRSASSASSSRASSTRTAERALAGAAAPARVVFASPERRHARRRRSFAALHGLYWLALNLAAERPLLLEVDDLHWCDRPWLRFLAYLVRRLEGQPVLVTAASAPATPPPTPRCWPRSPTTPPPPTSAPARCPRRPSASSSRARLGAEPDERLPRGLPHARPAATRCSSASC